MRGLVPACPRGTRLSTARVLSPSDVPNTAAASPAAPPPTIRRSKQRSGSRSTVRPRYSAIDPGVAFARTAPDMITTGRSVQAMPSWSTSRSTDSSLSGSSHSCGMRLRVRNSLNVCVSAREREPRSRIDDAAPLSRMSRRAMYAVRMVSPRRASVAYHLTDDAGGDAKEFTGLTHPSGDVHALTGQQIELSEEPSGTVLGDQAILTVTIEKDVDLPRDDDEEVVGVVARPIQVLTDTDRLSFAECCEERDLCRIQRRKGRFVVSHGQARGSPSCTGSHHRSPLPMSCPAGGTEVRGVRKIRCALVRTVRTCRWRCPVSCSSSANSAMLLFIAVIVAPSRPASPPCPALVGARELTRSGVPARGHDRSPQTTRTGQIALAEGQGTRCGGGNSPLAW